MYKSTKTYTSCRVNRVAPLFRRISQKCRSVISCVLYDAPGATEDYNYALPKLFDHRERN